MMTTYTTIQGILPIQGTAESHIMLAPQHLPVPPPAHETGVINAATQEKKHK